MTPTQRTLAYLRRLGLVCGVVERWNPHAKVRQDLFGFIDIVALDPNNRQIIGVQCTSASNRSSHEKKIRAEERAKAWCASGGQIMLVTWGKRGGRGKRKTWTPKVGFFTVTS